MTREEQIQQLRSFEYACSSLRRKAEEFRTLLARDCKHEFYHPREISRGNGFGRSVTTIYACCEFCRQLHHTTPEDPAKLSQYGHWFTPVFEDED